LTPKPKGFLLTTSADTLPVIFLQVILSIVDKKSVILKSSYQNIFNFDSLLHQGKGISPPWQKSIHHSKWGKTETFK
jgi:hypothetical protein